MKIKGDRKNRIYISGRISGLDIKYAKFKFANASFIAKNKMNLEPINPFIYGLRGNHKWITHMIFDIWLLMQCRRIYMMREWKYSKGARIEHFIARLLMMNIYYE